VPPYEIAVLVMMAAGVQFGLLGLALLIETSHRKGRPSPALRPSRGRRAERHLAPVPLRPRREAEPPAAAPPPAAPETQPPRREGAGPPEPAPPEMFQPSAETSRAEEPAAAMPEITPEAEPSLAAPEPAAEAELLEPEVQPAAAPAPVAPKLSRLGLGLRKTHEALMARLRAVLGGGAQGKQLYEELEEALIGADVGVEASARIVQAVRDDLKNEAHPETVRAALKAEIERVLESVERPAADSGDEPLVVMLVGVNGAGKTTTLAKLAARFKAERGPVIVAAADTFRAAAIDQLEVWCNRVGAEIIKQKQGSDPAAIAFDAVAAARARGIKTVLIDTAGRLQTKSNLMEELKKIARVAGRNLPGAPHETWLVLDATTGQNALSQAQVFKEAVPLTGVILAKLDSTAKGGVVIAIADRMKLPVRFVGIGESVEDLRPFDAHEFVEALFESEDAANQNASGSYAA